jgi:hypothetical protein
VTPHSPSLSAPARAQRRAREPPGRCRCTHLDVFRGALPFWAGLAPRDKVQGLGRAAGGSEAGAARQGLWRARGSGGRLPARGAANTGCSRRGRAIERAAGPCPPGAMCHWPPGQPCGRAGVDCSPRLSTAPRASKSKRAPGAAAAHLDDVLVFEAEHQADLRLYLLGQRDVIVEHYLGKGGGGKGKRGEGRGGRLSLWSIVLREEGRRFAVLLREKARMPMLTTPEHSMASHGFHGKPRL